MDFSKVKCPNCSDRYFMEKFWGSVPNPEVEIKVCFCRCLNCESWFSFKVKHDHLVDGSYTIEETEFMQDIEKSIAGDKHE